MFNDHLAGQTYIQLYEMDKSQEVRIADVKKSIDLFIETRDIEGRKFGDNWNWVDAAYMAMPLFAQLGTLTGRYLELKIYEHHFYKADWEEPARRCHSGAFDKLIEAA